MSNVHIGMLQGMAPRAGVRRRPAVRVRSRQRRIVGLAAVLLCAVCAALLALGRSSHAHCGRHVRLALSIQASSTSVAQIPRLLDAVWDACNVYAIHLDAKIPSAHRTALTESLLSKYPHNLHIVPSRPVAYAGVSMLLATLDALSLLLAERTSVPWAFFINISASDYPLVSAPALRALLSERELAGLNFFQRQQSTRPAEWFFSRRFATVHIDPALWGTDGDVVRVDVSHPAARPGALPLAKAEGWVILSADFARYAVDSTDARRLLALLANARAADEHYFPTLLALAGAKFPVAWDALRHIAWRNATTAFARPAFLDGPQAPALREGIVNSGAVFARKFSGAHSPVLDDIDAALVGRWGVGKPTQELRDSVQAHLSRVRRRAFCIARFRDGPLGDPHGYAACRETE